ncbi:IS110 family transposase [Micromonospora sp. WMMA1363]|uniref:IS110 family transposase n=1 Tax=Micromonospora sp. WMMA1363 TaxID=3053985 RepID=UPI00259CA19A|nr:IS110 family transposase [Micromonospora sp. WMMA1363]MDM4719052.1 IS110 family transposase [Micromonospora sp. WMMA1363]MDM4719912.1 IS110 family transposase [Micromonospora sp. WMMA1363]MDM4721995.1 IS110 family transposase [Micromonospora sp. WMMA1363]
MPPITPDEAAIEVVGGVDTHQDTHTAAVIDLVGRVLGTQQFPATRAGYAALLAWMHGHGRLSRVGVEGTGAYGAGLARVLRDDHVDVIEVDRPDRKTRRFQGKSDPIDAIQAARAALAGERTGTPKQRDGRVEALRNLRVARRSAVEQRADTQRQIKSLIVTAPDELRARLRGLTVKQLIATCANLRPDRADAATPATAVKIALRSLARRHQQLATEIADLDELLQPLVAAINPGLLAANGLGADTAGQLLVSAGENHDRLTSEAGFAMLCGVAPIPASSGKTTRHRLNRGGDRQANAAIYRVVLCRLRWDPRTRAYTERRTKEGLSKKEIIRCLKRYIARELYQIITANDLELAA